MLIIKAKMQDDHEGPSSANYHTGFRADCNTLHSLLIPEKRYVIPSPLNRNPNPCRL
jgi:hypothetical protein